MILPVLCVTAVSSQMNASGLSAIVSFIDGHFESNHSASWRVACMCGVWHTQYSIHIYNSIWYKYIVTYILVVPYIVDIFGIV